MKHTALYEIHKKNDAKIVEFAGWQMPVVYSGIRDEHVSVRSSAGLFDVSHMGEISIQGEEAKAYSQYITTNDVEILNEHQAQYTLLCNRDGGVVDDTIIYKFSDKIFLVCVNASNKKKDFEWVKSNSHNFDVKISDDSSKYSQIAIQGPNSPEILKKILGSEIELIRKFYFAEIRWGNSAVIVARTGYTGEDGYEIFLPWAKGPELWEALLEAGKPFDIKLCGLGARDTLRIEMGYSLYGNEIDEDINPFEAGLERYVKMDKGEFVGKSQLQKVLESGIKRELVGFEMLDKGIPRKNYDICKNDSLVGYVTSGTLSPSLGKSIGLGLVNSQTLVNNEIQIVIRGNKRAAKVVSIPFYKK